MGVVAGDRSGDKSIALIAAASGDGRDRLWGQDELVDGA
jgi:hypothetical protein